MQCDIKVTWPFNLFTILGMSNGHVLESSCEAFCLYLWILWQRPHHYTDPANLGLEGANPWVIPIFM